jgi:hypothetical protein
MNNEKTKFMIEIGDQSSRQVNGLMTRPNEFVVRTFDHRTNEYVYHYVDFAVLEALNPDLHRSVVMMLKAANYHSGSAAE